MATCYLGLGSNLGDRKANIIMAIDCLKHIKGVKIEKLSRIYETKPVGGPPQGKFLNAAVKISTSISPAALLKILKTIEKKLGRRKTVRFGPRPIDLDILLYGDRFIWTKTLQVPHPRMFEREFVLKPLREIF